MIAESPNLETVLNWHTALSASYVGIGNVWGVSYGAGNPLYEEPQDASRLTRMSEAITRFARTVETQEEFRGVVGRALGIFDGQLFLWIVTEDLDTKLTRSLFEAKAAIEQEVGSEFEIHVEPLGKASIEDLIPSEYVAF